MATETADQTVRVEGLCKEYATQAEPLVILRDVNLAVGRGQSLAIMGPSGSGKSTLLHILGTLDTPTAGHVRLDGQDPFALKEKKLAQFRNQKLGFVFQDHQLLPQCSALENVLVPTLAAPSRDDGALERARDLLERVGLSSRMHHRPADLSGGERQRVAIARALVHAPPILLCDEPTGNLDQATGASIVDCFLDLQRREQVALIVVTHNLAFAQRFDRMARLHDGRLTGEDGAG